MNKKTNRSIQRAPTAKPVTSIVPSATLVLDGELPLAASHGVSAPEPLAAHDVLHAAMAPLDGANAKATTPMADGATTEPAAATPDAVAIAKPKAKAKKPAKSAAAESPASHVAVPAQAAKVAKEKFVKVTFALPESEAVLLDALKKTHQGNGVALKKGQLLRAGLLAMADLDSEHIAKLVAHLPAAPVAAKKKK